MTGTTTIDVIVVGLGFGADFVPVYASHPGVGKVALCDPDAVKLDEYCDRYNIEDRFRSLDEALASDGYDAVHLVTPVTLHAAQARAVLESGRHCASAVPMGLSLEEIESVVEATARSGKNFMMMETAVYQREFFLAEELYSSGRMGPITFLRGMHIRDRTEMPGYWTGFPPMKYATHAVSPLLALIDRRVEAVHAFGSGDLLEENRGRYGNPFPLETSIFSLVDTTVKAEVTQGCFQTARPAQEGFSVYGEKMSLEWPQLGEDGVNLFTMHAEPVGAGSRFRRVDSEFVAAPDRTEYLPADLVPFTRRSWYEPGGGRKPVQVEAHHSGSHPHLVNEFVSSILEGRKARIDELTAADWCAPGICAHESALHGGERVAIPNFREPRRRA